MRPIIIIHGWSDNSKSFEPLAARLKANGFTVHNVWLGDYISKDDTVTIPDIAKRMEEVIADLRNSGAINTFDAIVHSTGGLVVRQWLTMFDRGRGSLKKLVMLAPANFGSGLAILGKSMIGRMTKGFDNWFQTGTQVLNALELGSPYQWQLAMNDVFRADSGVTPIYDENGCLPFVLSGTKGYTQLLRRALNEPGADGTVRASAANLSAYGLTLDFSANEGKPGASVWERQGEFERFAFRILPNEDHGSICSGDNPATFDLIVSCLNATDTNAQYSKLVNDWAHSNDQIPNSHDSENRKYFQLNTFVVDDQGNHIDDHFIEFVGQDNSKIARDRALDVFQREVIKNVVTNSQNKACKTFYLDRTALMQNFYKQAEAGTPTKLKISISATPPGQYSHYFESTRVGASGDYELHLEDENSASDRWLRRHSTHFLKIIIPRRPTKGVFKLRVAPD